MNIKIVAIPILTAAMLACSNNDKIVLRTINKQISSGPVNVDLKELPFDWDTLYVFNDRLRRAEIEAIIKNRMDYDMADVGTHLFFLNKSHLVYEEHWLACYGFNFERLNYPHISIDSDYLCIDKSNTNFILNPDYVMYNFPDINEIPDRSRQKTSRGSSP